MTRFEFMAGPWENATLPTIIRDNPTGGDPLILATLQRVHDPGSLHDLCRLANIAQAPDALRASGVFLLDRLAEWSADNLTDCTARDWFGHIEPAIARLRDALATGATASPP